MSASTLNLDLPLLTAAQANKHVTHNEAIRLLDSHVHLMVKTSTLGTPPVSPLEGDRHLVPTGGTGDWSGWDRSIALFVDGSWTRLVPKTGWSAWVANLDNSLVYDAVAAAWIPSVNLATLQSVGLLLIGNAEQVVVDCNDATISGTYGVNASATNRPPIPSSAGTLQVIRDSIHSRIMQVYQHAGGITYNGRTYRRVFDGSVWSRWWEAYSQRSLLGLVSESSGEPTGAVIEHGSNANGWFTRFADSTQICWRSVSINLAAAATANFTFPTTFVGGGDEVALSISWRQSTVDGEARAMCTIETGSSAVDWTVRNNSATGFTGARTAHLMAIGRWF